MTIMSKKICLYFIKKGLPYDNSRCYICKVHDKINCVNKKIFIEKEDERYRERSRRFDARDEMRETLIEQENY